MIGNQYGWLSIYPNGPRWIRLIGAAYARPSIWCWWEHSRQLALLNMALVSSRTALQYLATGSKWGQDKAKNQVVQQAISELERAARAEEIQVLGRPQNGFYYEKIKPHYWRTAGLDIKSRTRTGTTPRTELREWSCPNAIKYEDLLLPVRIEDLWPEAGRKLNRRLNGV